MLCASIKSLLPRKPGPERGGPRGLPGGGGIDRPSGFWEPVGCGGHGQKERRAGSDVLGVLEISWKLHSSTSVSRMPCRHLDPQEWGRATSQPLKVKTGSLLEGCAVPAAGAVSGWPLCHPSCRWLQTPLLSQSQGRPSMGAPQRTQLCISWAHGPPASVAENSLLVGHPSRHHFAGEGSGRAWAQF